MNSQETIVLADAHLDGFNAELDCFIAFLAELRQHAVHALFMLGDLCNIWLGTPKMHLPYQEDLITAFHDLRDAGIQLNYVEGNRDYFLRRRYLNNPFHNIASDFLQEQIGNTRVYFSHGDLVNLHDKPYRAWRAFSRNRLVFSVFNALPRSGLVRLVHLLERTFRDTNTRHKTVFPLGTCQRYAERLWEEGFDCIVLGHFHERHHVRPLGEDSSKVLYTLPAWKDSHAYLCFSPEGTPVFRHFS